MEAIAGIDIAVWDVKAQALGIPAMARSVSIKLR
jgi:L-alanine-DL-glutamate epimerase-like enolase superfamily enzyme